MTPLDTLLSAVSAHPGMMAPILIEALLQGIAHQRLTAKCLDTSPWFGALPDGMAVREALEHATTLKLVKRIPGTYAALTLTSTGKKHLETLATGPRTVASPDTAYAAYWGWRRAFAKATLTKPYRVIPNPVVNALATAQPTTLEELLGAKGLGSERALRFQADLLPIGRGLVGAKAGAL
ncbi:MAG: HRDC domain-containing protein [Elusimicrobia bacterium]|nr:HRDC domain-containing protein [Elusimicrobiota bacterium]